MAKQSDPSADQCAEPQAFMLVLEGILKLSFVQFVPGF